MAPPEFALPRVLQEREAVFHSANLSLFLAKKLVKNTSKSVNKTSAFFDQRGDFIGRAGFVEAAFGLVVAGVGIGG